MMFAFLKRLSAKEQTRDSTLAEWSETYEDDLNYLATHPHLRTNEAIERPQTALFDIQKKSA